MRLIGSTDLLDYWQLNVSVATVQFIQAEVIFLCVVHKQIRL